MAPTGDIRLHFTCREETLPAAHHQYEMHAMELSLCSVALSQRQGRARLLGDGRHNGRANDYACHPFLHILIARAPLSPRSNVRLGWPKLSSPFFQRALSLRPSSTSTLASSQAPSPGAAASSVDASSKSIRRRALPRTSAKRASAHELATSSTTIGRSR